MNTETLENKLMEFHSHYRQLSIFINFFASALSCDDSNEITRQEIDTLVEIMAEKTQGRIELLDKIIDEFQETYCKED